MPRLGNAVHRRQGKRASRREKEALLSLDDQAARVWLTPGGVLGGFETEQQRLGGAATSKGDSGEIKLVLEKAEEPEIKLPTSAGSSKKQESSRKTSISVLLTPSLHEIFPWYL